MYEKDCSWGLLIHQVIYIYIYSTYFTKRKRKTNSCEIRQYWLDYLTEPPLCWNYGSKYGSELQGGQKANKNQVNGCKMKMPAFGNGNSSPNSKPTICLFFCRWFLVPFNSGLDFCHVRMRKVERAFPRIERSYQCNPYLA